MVPVSRDGSRLLEGWGSYTTGKAHLSVQSTLACEACQPGKLDPLRWNLRVISAWVHRNFYFTVVLEVTALLECLNFDTVDGPGFPATLLLVYFI